jgi:hypothetical protein
MNDQLIRRKRPLSLQEITLAQSIIVNAADWSKVLIADGAWWLVYPHTAITCNNTIVFPRNYYQQDFSQCNLDMQAWFVHELVHVWQHQHGFPILFAGVCLAIKGGYYRARAYQYPDLSSIKSFDYLNMEQQARVIQHYFLAKNGDPRYVKWLPQYRRLLKPLLQNPHNRHLLPRHY